MYQKEYEKWLENVKENDLLNELEKIKENDDEIKDRFLINLSFGTAGLRGVLGAGTNRMNEYTVAKATQGLANFLNKENENPSVAIAYDSRIKSDVFSKIAAEVLVANNIKVYIYNELRPVPMLSFATRQYNCTAGIMVTASHNPAKYNGYKVYGSDGCQMTETNANAVLEEINSLDLFNDIKRKDFNDALNENLIEYISKETEEKYYSWCINQMLNKDIFQKTNLKMVYTPLNGAGNIPVKKVFNMAGFSDIITVKEQEMPDGNFPTCPYPNPEIKQAMQLGLDLTKKENADILIATDPDADRVGIALKDGDDYTMLSGNQVGILLIDYIAKMRKLNNNMPKNPVMVKSIVTSSLADEVAKSHDIETINVLTGFKYIGETILNLEEKGEEDRFLFGFEESYGYLVGTQVRDKDAVVASLLIAEMAAYYILEGTSLIKVLEGIYEKFGYYLNVVDSYEFEGLKGMDKMKEIMASLRENPLKTIGGYEVAVTEDYKESLKTDLLNAKTEKINLPSSNILTYYTKEGNQIIIRPSGTEPKIKVYFSLKGKDADMAKSVKEKIDVDIAKILK